MVRAEPDIGRMDRHLSYWLIARTVLWTVLPLLFHANLQRDQIEGFAWGYEWQWGFAKHPPLWAWILESTTFLTGQPSAAAAYFVGAASGSLALYFVRHLAGRAVTPAGAVVAVLMLEGVLYLNFRTVDFNANVVLLPAWAAAGYFLHRAILDDRLRDWLGLGAALAVGMYGKYATGVLILTIVGFILFDPTARRRLGSIRPWAGALFGLTLLTPHLFWLAENGLQPVDYAMARTGANATWSGHVLYPLSFLGKQIPEILGAVVLAGVLFLKRGGPGGITLGSNPPVVERRMITALALGPLTITALICAGLGRPFVAAWALPMFIFCTLPVVIAMGDVPMRNLSRFLRAVPIVVTVIIAAFIFYYGALPELRHKPTKTQFPGTGIARAVSDAWASVAPGRDLRFVGGPIYVAGNAAFHLARQEMGLRPHVVIDGDPAISPWIDPQELARDGVVLVWLDEGQGLPAFLQRFPGAVIQPGVSLRFERAASLPPLALGLAVVAPKPE